MEQGKFVTAINCMDGRVQEPVVKYMKENYKADYVDMITEPGPIKIMFDNTDAWAMQSIYRRIDVSVMTHASDVIAVVGHHDCAGNPMDKFMQAQQIKSAIEDLKVKYQGIEMIGLWVNEKWEVEKI